MRDTRGPSGAWVWPLPVNWFQTLASHEPHATFRLTQVSSEAQHWVIFGCRSCNPFQGRVRLSRGRGSADACLGAEPPQVRSIQDLVLVPVQAFLAPKIIWRRSALARKTIYFSQSPSVKVDIIIHPPLDFLSRPFPHCCAVWVLQRRLANSPKSNASLVNAMLGSRKIKTRAKSPSPRKTTM